MKMLQILNAEMQADIDSKKQKVKLLEDEININTIKALVFNGVKYVVE